MSVSHQSDVQSLVGIQLAALADLLAVQPPGVADAPSLCTGWAVKNVVAHMTMAARYDTAAFMRKLALAENDFDRLSESVASQDGELPFSRLLEDLRSEELSRWAPPVGGPIGALSHAVIHGLDITSALDLDRTSDDAACELVLDSLTARPYFGLTAAGRLLRATDLDWQRGEGDRIDASAADLILALAGRPRPGIDLPEITS